MAQYKVLSENLDGFAKDATVNDDDLAGFNVAALIAGGHLATIVVKQPSKTDDKDK